MTDPHAKPHMQIRVQQTYRNTGGDSRTLRWPPA